MKQVALLFFLFFLGNSCSPRYGTTIDFSGDDELDRIVSTHCIHCHMPQPVSLNPILESFRAKALKRFSLEVPMQDRPLPKQRKVSRDIAKIVGVGDMPPSEYILLTDAEELSAKDIRVIVKWAEKIQK